MDSYIFSLLLNIILLIIIMAMLPAYHKQENSYRKQLLDKMHSLIQCLGRNTVIDNKKVLCFWDFRFRLFIYVLT
jgi:uncharacterized protein (UPF0333 family)